MATCCLPWEEALQRLFSRLVAFAATPRIRQHEAGAAAIFWKTQRPLQPGTGQAASESLRFLEWYLHDYPRDRGHGPVIAEFADTVMALSMQEEALLFASLLAPVRAYEVTEIWALRGVVAKDLLTGEEHAVGPLGLPQLPIRSDVVICRLLPVGRLVRPGAGVLVLPGAGREEMLAYLRTAYRLSRPLRHVSLEDFLDNAVHLYHHFFLLRERELRGRALETLWRAPFEPGEAVYLGTDLPRIQAGLDRLPELERQSGTPGEACYVWLDPDRALARATIRLRSSEVVVGAETRGDLSDAKTFLETCLRGLIQPAGKSSGADGDHPGIEASRPRSGAPGAAFFARMLDGWPEVPSPRLDDRTPREMCRTRSGRERVAGLLLELERGFARLKRLGRASADVGIPRERLRLPATPPASCRGPS